MVEFSKSLKVTQTEIPGLLLIDLPVHGDNRGWFKENWQRDKMLKLGLPDFGPVQNNISFNDEVGTTRGIHAEPWDKFVSVATGKIFGAWVDLREGDSFGKVFTIEVDPSVAVFVPGGVANAYQTLEPETAYVYLVNDHWYPDAKYTFVNVADPNLQIQWPIPLDSVQLSDKDKAHPMLSDVVPMKPKATLVIGANGQLGRALQEQFADAEFWDRSKLDLSDLKAIEQADFSQFSTVINATAYTAVDQAETSEGRVASWKVNVSALSALVEKCRTNRITLVHVSSDYVFDGRKAGAYSEQDEFCPLGVYGQTKAAGDALVASLPKHFIVRTSWVIGEGKNFVRIMADLANRGVSPAVVNDQVGRLSFTSTIAAGIKHLLVSGADFGTYNLTNSGQPAAWNQIAEQVFEAVGKSASSVTGISTDEYFKGKQVAPRPLNSILDLTKIEATGFKPTDWRTELAIYLAQ